MKRNGYRWVCICLIASKHQRNSKGVENGNLHFSRFDQIFAFDDSNCYSDQHCTFPEYIRQQQQTTFFLKLEYILWLHQLTAAKMKFDLDILVAAVDFAVCWAYPHWKLKRTFGTFHQHISPSTSSSSINVVKSQVLHFFRR